MIGRQINRLTAAILLLLLPVLLNACAGHETMQTKVVNEYLLTSAGFGKLDVNDTTPNRQALWDATVKNQFVTYYVGGVKYYVYADNTSNALYIGDEAAYQKFLSKIEMIRNSAKAWTRRTRRPFGLVIKSSKRAESRSAS